MPTLQIISIYKKRKRMFGDELSKARADVEHFRACLAVRFGKEVADAIGREAKWSEGVKWDRSESMKLSEECVVAVETLRVLNRKVMAVWRNIRAANCWFRESPGSVSVLETVGLSWHVVHEKCVANGKFSVTGTLWLLRVLRTAEQGMPAVERGREEATTGLRPCRLPKKWRELLRRRRRRLAVLSVRQQSWRKTFYGSFACSRQPLVAQSQIRTISTER